MERGTDEYISLDPPREGRVDIFSDNKWRGLCVEEVNTILENRLATTVCQSLGYPIGLKKALLQALETPLIKLKVSKVLSIYSN